MEMKSVEKEEVRALTLPDPLSHKGQNGRLLVIGGSHLFHAASLWALTVASRIVDLVHYSSVPENNELVEKMKEEFRNGIVTRRADIDDYIMEDDCILIGPGMTRDGETEELTNRLLAKYPEKQWVIDAGAIQMMDVKLIPKNAILTPHQGEFEWVWDRFEKSQNSNFETQTHSAKVKTKDSSTSAICDKAVRMAQTYQCYILVKGPVDCACSPEACRIIEGGNAGMTKGGTGDVLSGLIAALACKNNPFLAMIAGSYINKTAGDDLFKSVGTFFNASDLADQIPKTMGDLLYGNVRKLKEQ